MGYQPITLEAQRNFPLRPGVLWDLLANTDDLDREIGMPTVAYGPVVVSADGFYRQAAARFWGLLAVRWREYPFEWVRGERYAVLRAFEAGFLDTFYGGAELSPNAEGTSVRLFAEVTPRTLIGWGVARLMGWKGIRYGADLKQNVELRYSVHPALRGAKDEIYCIGGPANSPHVWVQQYLLPGTERTLSVTLPNEAFRVRALRVHVTCPLEPDPGGESEVAFTYRDDGWYQLRQRFSPGRVSVRLRNEAAHVLVVVIEQVRWDPRAITAAQVMLLPEFRDLAAPEAPAVR